MKTRTITFLAIALLAGCVKEEVLSEETSLKTFDCFTVGMEDSGITKVYMEEGGVVKWNEWDQIQVFSDTQSPVTYYRRTDGKFYGDKISGHTFYAYYDVGFEYDQENPTVLKYNNLSGVCNSGTFYLPIVAVGADNNLTFRQTCGLLHFKVKSQCKVYGVELEGNENEIINCKGSIDLSQRNPVFMVDTDYAESWSRWINVAVSPGGSYDDGEWDFYLAVPEMTFEKGFTLKVFCEEAEGISRRINKTTSSSVPIERGWMTSFSLIDLDGEIENLEKTQREALTALYNALDGDHWTNNTNWLSDKPLNEWYGVWTDLGNVTELNLQGNELSGELPPEIGKLSSLHYLYLNYNSGLTGPIPSEIGNLTKAWYLGFSQCNLTGTIPKEMGRIKDLNTLNLCENKLEGEVPKELCELTGLHSINLGGNRLTGTLPEFPNSKELEYLILDGNKFTGQIPESYAQWPDCLFRLNFNYLSGDVPESFQKLKCWDYHWPFLICQLGEGFNFDSLDLKGPKFSVTATDGTVIDDSIYGRNEYTLLFEFDDYDFDYYNIVYELYCNYKKKGLEVIGYVGGLLTNEEVDELAAIFGFPWKNFRYDGASTVCSFIPFSWDDPVYMLNNRFPAVNVVDRNGDIVFTPYRQIGNSDIIMNEDNPVGLNGMCMNLVIDDLEHFITEKLGEPDPFNPIGPDAPYASTDYSSDGKVHILQTATRGNGIDIVLMGDAFSDRLISDGTYQQQMERAAEAFFLEEPYQSYKDCFNVYYVDVVSKNETYFGETSLNTWYGGGTAVGGDNGKVFEYAEKAVSEDSLNDALVIVLMNRDYYAGTCNMYAPQGGDYGSGRAIAYFPVHSDDDIFRQLVSHEAGGHGFGKLADEYEQYQLDPSGKTIPEDKVASYRSEEPYGFWKNVDFTPDPAAVKWSRFIADSRYEPENINVYEGACYYSFGVYRPTSNSIMRDNVGGFNAPSRQAIWYRINKLAFGADWSGNYEDFVTWDLAHRTPDTKSARPITYVEREFEPLAPPVMINKDWREAVREEKNKR